MHNTKSVDGDIRDQMERGAEALATPVSWRLLLGSNNMTERKLERMGKLVLSKESQGRGRGAWEW